MFRSVRTVLAGFGLALLTAFSAPASAQGLQTLGTADQGRGWEAVGRLDLGQEGFCTAALISDRVALTAAHCVFDRRTGAPIEAGAMQFQAGLRFGRAEAHRGVRRVVVHPGYDFAGRADLGRIGSDMALLELDRPIRTGRVSPFRTETRVEPGASVQVVSYARDRAEAPSREEACRVLTRDAAVLVLSCEVDFGASGAPVFVVSDGEIRIISVVSAKARWEGRDVALAAAMGGELGTLIAAFDADGSSAPVASLLTARDIVETRADG